MAYEPTGNPVGRPTDYTPELLARAKWYVAGEWKKANDGEDKIPSHIGLAKHLEISRLTLYRWAKEEDKDELRNILEDCNAEQQSVLLNNGLDSTFNSNIVKLVLGKHGFHDKSSTELTGAGGGAIDMKWTVEIVEPKGE